MSECPCRSFYPTLKAKLSDERWLFIQPYYGCRECNCPAGIMFWALNDDDADACGALDPARAIKDFEVRGWPEFIPVLEPYKLIRSGIGMVIQYIGDLEQHIIDDAYYEATPGNIETASLRRVDATRIEDLIQHGTDLACKKMECGHPFACQNFDADGVEFCECCKSINSHRKALAFAACVIKSGEPWTETCEREIGELIK